MNYVPEKFQFSKIPTIFTPQGPDQTQNEIRPFSRPAKPNKKHTEKSNYKYSKFSTCKLIIIDSKWNRIGKIHSESNKISIGFVDRFMEMMIFENWYSFKNNFC